MNELDWISVDDELPERSYRLYLVWREHPGTKYSPGPEVCEWDAKQHEWYGWDSVAHVTHWSSIDLYAAPQAEVVDGS